MTSKVLTNEYEEKINDGTVLTYGSPNEKECDIISIHVKGRIKPTEDKKDYKQDSRQLKENTIKHVAKLFNGCDWINPHHIFTCDFTERGILYNKPFRFKYQVYVKPNVRGSINAYKDHILDITTEINGIIDGECKRVGFEIIK